MKKCLTQKKPNTTLSYRYRAERVNKNCIENMKITLLYNAFLLQKYEEKVNAFIF